MAEPQSKHRSSMVLQGILPLDRSRLPGDIVAGTTLAALGIPEVMGYADIAGMPVYTGLYTILIPIAVFAFLGSSRHLVVGADSASAAILAAGLASFAAEGSPQYVALAGGVALAAGVALLVARLIRLGFLADFLSRSVLIGFLTGVGIQVAMGQVAGILGVKPGTGGTVGSFVRTLGKVAETNRTTLVVSLVVLVVIVGCKRIDRRIPGALIAVIGAIVASSALDLGARGVDTLGAVPSGLPRFGLPDVKWDDIWQLASTVGAIVLVILAQSAATSRAYAARYEESFSENVDLVGLGAANLAAGLSGTFVVNGSPTKTQMVDSAGGRSQLSQLTTALVVLLVLLFLTGPLQYMPDAVLAAVVLLIGVELIDIKGMRGIWRVRRDEFVIAAITAAVVVVVGVKEGVLLAIVLSVLDYVRRGYRPSRSLIVANPRGHLHRQPLSSGEEAVPGLVIYRFGSSLFFANANAFEQDLLAVSQLPDARWVCVDAGAVADVDFTGWKTIGEIHRDLEKRGVKLVFADLPQGVQTEFERYGLMEQLGPHAVFSSVGDAMEAYRRAEKGPEPHKG